MPTDIAQDRARHGCNCTPESRRDLMMRVIQRNPAVIGIFREIARAKIMDR